MIKNNLLFTPLELQIESLAGYYDLHKFTKRIPLTECPPQAKIFVISVRYKGDFPLQNERRRRKFFGFGTLLCCFAVPSQSQSVQKKSRLRRAFFPYGNAIWPKVAYGNRFGNPPPAPRGGASKELSEGDSGTRKPMFHIFAFPEALWLLPPMISLLFLKDFP